MPRQKSSITQEPALEVLTTRQLNRALLARQMLLERQKTPVAEAVERLVGMQAQIPNNPYVGLWSRIDGFDPLELSQMMAERSTLRLTLLRGTIHLVTARDCLSIRPVLQPVLERLLASGSPYGKRLKGVNMTDLLSLGRAFIEEKPLTARELGEELHQHWPERDPQSLAAGIAYTLATAQVTPRGMWGRSGRSMITSAESWLGQPLIGDSSPDVVVMRYLAAFGPASVADIQTWSGLTGLREVMERLRPRLRSFHDERGRELLDVPDGPLPDPDTPAPVRFLPEYDNVFLSHSDRSRIVSEEDRKRTWRANGYAAPLLIHGFGGGLWKISREKRNATLRVEVFAKLSGDDQTALEDEAAALLAFMTPEATVREVQVLVSA